MTPELHGVSIDCLSCPADPAHPESCEDTYVINEARGIAILADGAGTTFDPRGWASLLTRVGAAMVRRATADELLSALQLALHEWLSHGPQLVPEDGLDPKPSGATLGLLVVEPPNWSFAAVGDLNLMLCSPSGAALSLANLRSSDDYGYHPELLVDGSLEARAYEASGTCRPGDVLFCFSDGIGQWLVDHAEPGIVLDLCSADTAAFVAFVENLRASLDLVRDDATLIRVFVT